MSESERALGSQYVLVGRIGHGASGEVWEGRNQEGAPLAFKLLRAELVDDPAIVRRFVGERSILTAVQSPNIVAVHDLVVEGRTLAIVQDLVEGQDLRTFIKRHGNVPPEGVADLGAGIAAGLAAIHEAGVVHRDLKPENVLLAQRGSELVPRIADFGIASLIDPTGTHTSTTSIVGTPQYIAPEVADGQVADARSDLYALGILLYELASGVTPFAGNSAIATLKLHATAQPGRPNGIPDDLWELILHLVAKDPGRRPHSARAVARQLMALRSDLAGQPAAPTLQAPPRPVPIADQAQYGQQAPDLAVHQQVTEKVAQRQSASGTADPTRQPSSPASQAGSHPAPDPKAGTSTRGILIAIAVVAALVALAVVVFAFSRGDEKRDAGATTSSSNSQGPTDSPTVSDSPTTASPSTTTQTTTPTATPTEMPNLVGKTVAQAQALLPGVTITTEDDPTSAAPNGQIVKQDSEEGSYVPDELTLTVASTPDQLNLVDYPSTNDGGAWQEQAAESINGKEYVDSLSTDFSSYNCDTREQTYNLNRKWGRVQGVVGLSADSGHPKGAHFELRDQSGKVLWSKDVSLTSSAKFDVSVKDTLRLVLRVTGTDGCESDSDADYSFVVGTPVLRAAGS